MKDLFNQGFEAQLRGLKSEVVGLLLTHKLTGYGTSRAIGQSGLYAPEKRQGN